MLTLVSGATALAAPSNVDIRIEGATTTLLERTAIRTDGRTVNKDGIAGHDCTGTSAAGALEIGTAGDWNGTWFAGLGYTFETILGESHAFPEPDFFSLWINNREAQEGICGASSELQEGDDVLFFVARCEFDGSACTNAPVLPLGLTAPALVSPGVPFNVRVVEYSTTGTPSPVAGASVAGADATATTNAAGNATLTLASPGRRVLKTTLAGHARSAAEQVCASSTAVCGVAPTPPAGPDATAPVDPGACETNGHDGRCGTRDTDAPGATVVGIDEQERFRRRKAPRRLRARIDSDPSGLLIAKIRLTRRFRGRCTYFSGRSERFRPNKRGGRCGAGNGYWFGVGDRERINYLLPGKLPRGRYVLDVNAIDKAYNRDDRRRREGNRIVFHVRR
ncbi:MAG: hypothetical protein ACR2LK_12210 [Solirubrobacteraceae bacterium]